MTEDDHTNFIERLGLDLSAVLTVIGIALLFSTAVIVTLIAPSFIDPTWTTPTNPYQVQMYEISDPNFYISSASGFDRQTVYHLKEDFTLLAFEESDLLRIISADDQLEKYITHPKDKLILTSKLLLLRSPSDALKEKSEKTKADLQKTWEQQHAEELKSGTRKPTFQVWELYAPDEKEAFALAPGDSNIENWVDHNFVIIEESAKHSYHNDPGVIYVKNPQEYRITYFTFGSEKGWRYDPNGKKIANLQTLKSHPLGFMSRKELIELGEHIVAIEGCWYCHTDQTRTLIQDVVLNGSDSYPAPPSSANEYVYQRISFPGTRRIGPDISRVGIKRPSRDWHMSHFWSPKTASRGSIMPAFRHFFDDDPRGTAAHTVKLPNYQFEAVFQYLMTKGTRITPPTEAWWLGRDPIRTKEVIEGKRKLP